jgi:hypothetical protein
MKRMTSTGFGDITTANLYETFFVILSLLTSCFYFSFSFNSIGVIIEDLNKDKKNFLEQMRVVNRYLTAK